MCRNARFGGCSDNSPAMLADSAIKHLRNTSSILSQPFPFFTPTALPARRPGVAIAAEGDQFVHASYSSLTRSSFPAFLAFLVRVGVENASA
jgi:hypothetical protein